MSCCFLIQAERPRTTEYYHRVNTQENTPPSDDFQSWVDRQRGGQGVLNTTSDASIQPSRRFFQSDNFRCVCPLHVLEETGSATSSQGVGVLFCVSCGALFLAEDSAGSPLSIHRYLGRQNEGTFFLHTYVTYNGNVFFFLSVFSTPTHMS